jgi:D-glycero-D-manno-heptose 1,7-bisphosphate phosphatase
MIQQACAEMGLDATRSFMVGDRLSDIAAGEAAGAKTILVRTGRGAHEVDSAPYPSDPDAILNNLMEAVGWILRSSSRSSAR